MPEASCEFSCYHCGLPIPEDLDLSVDIDGEARAMCCAGCQAVAQAIVANGLDDYYRSRDAMPESPREAMPAMLEELALFDHPDVQKSFVRSLEPERARSVADPRRHHLRRLHLAQRAACRQAGGDGGRHQLRDAPRPGALGRARVKLSEILEAIAAIGYRAHPYDAARSEELARKERRAALWRLFVAGFGMMQVMMYAVPVYLAEGDMTADIESLMRWASLVLTLPVIFYSAAPFFRNAWRDLKLRRVGMDVPVALGVGAAFVASVWATLTGRGEVYFDSVTMFVFFLLGGRFLEMTARQKAVSVAEALAGLLPAFAQSCRNFPVDRSTEQRVVADLHAGRRGAGPAGEIVPADGEVIEGESSADEALLTGESRAGAEDARESR